MTWFLVLRSYHDYDGGSDTPLGITDDEDKARAVVADWERRKARSVEIKTMCGAARDAWMNDNPRPALANISSQAKLPHEGIPKKKMTAQQLEDRKLAQAAHYEKLQNANKPFRDWSEAQSQFMTKYLEQFTDEEREDVGLYGYSCINDDFSYEEIKEL